MDLDRARTVLLEVIADQSARFSQIRTSPVLQDAATRLREENLDVDEHALLTAWYDLFRMGVISWGRSLSAPDAPLAHLTPHGRNTLAHAGRDPANPAGYLATLDTVLSAGTIPRLFVEESLRAYGCGCHGAAAVTLGMAAETLLLDLHDALSVHLSAAGAPSPESPKDHRGNAVREAVHDYIQARAHTLPDALAVRFATHWPLSQPLGITRTHAGRPASLAPVTVDVVHAMFLVFPEYARLVADLRAWAATVTA